MGNRIPEKKVVALMVTWREQTLEELRFLEDAQAESRGFALEYPAIAAVMSKKLAALRAGAVTTAQR